MEQRTAARTEQQSLHTATWVNPTHRVEQKKPDRIFKKADSMCHYSKAHKSSELGKTDLWCQRLRIRVTSEGQDSEGGEGNGMAYEKQVKLYFLIWLQRYIYFVKMDRILDMSSFCRSVSIMFFNMDAAHLASSSSVAN